MLRTQNAGTLRASDIGSSVTLAGWVARSRDHGGVAFVDLRDASGVVQVVVRDEVLAASGAHELRNEYCIRVVGVVEARPDGNANPDLPTGEIEVAISELTVLNPSAPLPFQIDERVSVGEEARLKYRYLDLRRPAPARAIRLRSRVNAAARRVLDARDFVEIETPTMTRSTPEGARDFIVPARLAPGSWYALPQSPQLFKQLLMVAGMERYYQIARCYRDEDFRADRQPEFTQLDIEMSFVDQDDVIAVAEEISFPETSGTMTLEPGPEPKYQPVAPASAASTSTRAKSHRPRAWRRSAVAASAVVLSKVTAPARVLALVPNTWVSASDAREGTGGRTMVWEAPVAVDPDAVSRPSCRILRVSRTCSSIARASRGRCSGSRAVAHNTSSSSSTGTFGFLLLGVGTVSFACCCAIWNGCSPLKGCSPASISYSTIPTA